MDCHPCPQGKVSCNETTTQCIEEKKVCDGVNHCLRGTDEANCESCPVDRWKCSLHPTKCIPKTSVCDGKNDCPLNTDEKNCSVCPEGRFKCREQGSSQCLDQTQQCDGIQHCYSMRRGYSKSIASDESDCDFCNKSAFKCLGERVCVSEFRKCDGHADCPKGSDESGCENCTADKPYKCHPGKCMTYCDGVTRCNSFLGDELDCHAIAMCFNISISDVFRCDGGRCRRQTYVCDGHTDCIDKSDEQNCHQHRCEVGYW